MSHLHKVAARRARGACERRHEVALDRHVEARGQLAGDAEVAHLVGAIGGDLRLHDRLARDHRRERLARDPGVEDEDPGVVVAEQELGR